jgi:translation elongation factor EF-4
MIVSKFMGAGLRGGFLSEILMVELFISARLEREYRLLLGWKNWGMDCD